MDYEDPGYLYPVEWINQTEGAARPAGIYLLDGMVRVAARWSLAELALQRAGALYVATLCFERNPFETRRESGAVVPVAPRRWMARATRPAN